MKQKIKPNKPSGLVRCLEVKFAAFGADYMVYCDDSIKDLNRVMDIISEIWETAHHIGYKCVQIEKSKAVLHHINTGKPFKLN